MLGAEGVQMGTAFIATKEAAVHERYKACIVRAKDIDSDDPDLVALMDTIRNIVKNQLLPEIFADMFNI